MCNPLNYFLRLFQEIFYRSVKLIIDILVLAWMPISLAYKSITQSTKSFKSILITGASQGIGAGLAEHYAKEGVHLFLTARSETKLNDVKIKCENKGATVTVLVGDVTNKERMEEVLRAADEEKPLDLVVANAGLSGGLDQNFTTTVNCNGVINTVWPAYQILKKRKSGQICINASVSGHFGGWPTEFAYAASKAFAIHYGRGLRCRAKKHNVGVTIICPGLVNTAIAESLSLSKIIGIDTKRSAEYISYACERNLGNYVFPRFYDLYIYYWQTFWTLDDFVC